MATAHEGVQLWDLSTWQHRDWAAGSGKEERRGSLSEPGRVLEDLARGAPEPELTRHVQAALQRLARQPSPPH
jgi:hypothetical protein